MKYKVEPIETQRPPQWGDLDPSGKKLYTGGYGQKYPGAVKPEDSVITEENGYENIVILEPGQSPQDYIFNKK